MAVRSGRARPSDTVLGQLVADLAEIDRHNAEHEDAPAQQIQAHIFLYEPSEAAGLQNAEARHLENPLGRRGLLHLIRIFPPEDVVPEPELRGIHHLPATALRSVVEQVFALPIMVSYDLRQVTCALAEADPRLSRPYAPERPDFASSGTLLVDVAADAFEGDDFQRLLRETGERGWFLDRTFKDFTTGRAADFLAFLAETRA